MFVLLLNSCIIFKLNILTVINSYIERCMAEYDTYRKCRSCGFIGYMDRWIAKRIYPHLIALVLLLFGLVPGILFMYWNRHKLICPGCRKIRN